MKVVRTVSELRLEGEVGLVPTMGALHAGHVGDGAVGHAQEQELRIAGVEIEAALEQAACDGRADTACADDVDSCEHGVAPAP